MPVDLPPPPRPESMPTQPRIGYVLLLQLITLALLALVIWLTTGSRPAHLSSGLLPAQTRNVASKLKAAGALEQAAQMYARYMNLAGSNNTERAAICFSLGKLYLEQGQYEKALRWFYQAETLGTDKELTEELGNKIVHCLEAMGRVHAAKAALDRRTRLEEPRPERSADDPVVARIGKNEIHRSDVTRAMDDLPPFLKQRFSGQSGSVEFLKKYLADELVFEKAKKLEIDKDPEVRRNFQALLKQLVVGRFIETQILDKLEINPADLKNHFEANREKYDEPQSARIRLIKLADLQAAQKLREKIQQGASFQALARAHSLDDSTKNQGGLIKGWTKKGQKFLDQGDPTAISEAVFSTPRGQVSDPVPINGHYYLFKIDEIQKGKQRTFEEAQRQVEADYRLMKTQAAYAQLIQETLSAEDVELFEEKMVEEK